MIGNRWRLTGARIRRVVQLLALALFVGLLLATRIRGGEGPPGAVKLFFWLDPLVLAATFLAAHAVPLMCLLALATVAATLLLGRVFCGWVCPLGTIHDIAGRTIDFVRGKRPGHEHFSRWQRAKYYLLAAFAVMALLGAHWVTIFDPLVLLYRSITAALLPGFQWAVEEASTVIYRTDPGIGSARVTAITEPAYRFLRDGIFAVQRQSFEGAWLILVVFAAVVGMNALRRRWWCRYICPLGAMLGALSIRPLLRRRVDAGRCTGCDLCSAGCHGAAATEEPAAWKPAECMLCLNCTEACRRSGLAFTAGWPWQARTQAQRLDISRRALVASAAGGLAGLWLVRSSPLARGNTYNPSLVRPPGARAEREFLQRCTACGMCIKVCPTGGLQPALGEAGLEGLWTPRLVPQIGHCEYNCTLCGQVCPTGAIAALSVEEKHKVRIGLAAFDVRRCIPYAYGRDCMVCEEHCPIPDKAIFFVDAVVQDHDGARRTVKQPRVDPSRCIGCGICEHVCVFKDRPAVRVFSANESRHPDNQPILGEPSPY